MKTKTKTEDTIEKPETTGDSYRVIEHSNFNPDAITVVSNSRKVFDKRAMEELTENVRRVGVLQSVILRPNPDGGYILVAGERRLRAALAADLKAIPGTVLDIDENQAAEVQALENLHRKDLTPIEEARAFKTLFLQDAYKVEDIARRVDKSVGYVYRAMRLLDLPEKVLELIEAGTLTAAHGHQFLRVPANQVQDLLERIERNGGRYETAIELEGIIHNRCKTLKEAIFPTNKPYAGMEACNACTLNSSNQGKLFDQTEKGLCSSVECYNAKTGAKKCEAIVAMLKTLPEGVKDLGIKQQDYNGTIDGMRKAKVIAACDTGKMAKQVKAVPTDFGVAYLESHYGGNEDTGAALVWLHPPKDKAAATTPNDDYQKQRFIEKAVERALLETAWEKMPVTMDYDMLSRTLQSLACESYNVGYALKNLLNNNEDEGLETKISELDPKVLNQTIHLAHIIIAGLEDNLKAMKVDTKAITKAAKAQALKDYKVMKAAKKAARPETEDAENGEGDAE